jgi:hypothetical protein
MQMQVLCLSALGKSQRLNLLLLLLQLQAERDSVQNQFKQLYHDKYQPLKVRHQAALDSNQQLQEQQQQTVEKLRTQLATADLKVRKAGLDVQSLTQQLQKSQDDIQVSRLAGSVLVQKNFSWISCSAMCIMPKLIGSP